MSETRCFGCMNLKQSYPVCEHCGHDQRIPNAPHQLPPGTVLRDQYVVGRVLGQGGFGITYIGWDLFLDIPVAIKEYYPNTVVTRNCTVSTSVFLRSEDSKDLFVRNRDRFAREARSLARLGAEGQMPNIVRVQNLVQANDTAYIIMEYVRGIDLRSYMLKKGGILSPEEMIRLLHPVMESLEKLHGHNIIHRDLSPDNIMVLPTGDTKLIDFGAVHEVKQNEQGQQLSTEVIVKHGFAPPEQYTRKGRLGPWTDVYAMSATVYYSLTGKVPPSATDRQFEGEPIDWSGVDPRFQAALEKGMTLRIEDRFQSIAELLDSLCAVPVRKKPEEKKAPAPVRKKEAPQEDSPKTAATVATKKPRIKWPVIAGAAVAVIALFLINPKSQPVSEEQQMQMEATVPTKSMKTTESTIPVESVASESKPDAWKDNVLMDTGSKAQINNYIKNNSSYYILGSLSVENIDVRSVTFLDTLEDAPADSWDVSADNTGRVKAWVKYEALLCDLYIGADGGINAGNACENMFLGFTSLQEINFGTAFHTEETTSMARMFRRCTNLTAVDVSGFDTSRVTDMSEMFCSCIRIKSLDLRNFDTSNVENMSDMFSSCDKLTKSDVYGFDTNGRSLEDIGF